MTFKHTIIKTYSKIDDNHQIRNYNFHYYFAPNKKNYDLPLTELSIQIIKIFDHPIIYPKYDQLIQELDTKTINFRTTLIPNQNNNDPLNHFKTHTRILKNKLKLMNKNSKNETYQHYTYKQNKIAIIMNLYDPTNVPWSTDFATSFRKKLKNYTLIHYNEHSNYESKNLLNKPESFSDTYQIISIHNYQNYTYYTHQIFQTKNTTNNPNDHSLANILTTSKSSYPTNAPPTLRILLQNLLNDMNTIAKNNPKNAPNWITIDKRMSNSTFDDIIYNLTRIHSNQ